MVQEFMSVQSQIAISQLNIGKSMLNEQISSKGTEVKTQEPAPLPQDFIEINQKPYEILFKPEKDQHELPFELDTFLSLSTDTLTQAFDYWYSRKFIIILKIFNECNETAIQTDQILPKLQERTNSYFEGNMVSLFVAIVEEMGYTVKEGLEETIFKVLPFIRFINILIVTKKGDYVANGRNICQIYQTCIDKKIEQAKDKIKDQYPKLFEDKSYKGYTKKDSQPIQAININNQIINLYEGLRLIKTSLFIDVYDTPDIAEQATLRAFVHRLTNLLKRNIVLLKHKQPDNTKAVHNFQYLRRMDGCRTTIDDMVKEVYRQSIATQITIDDLAKPEAKILKTLEKYIEKEKSIFENIAKLYEQINLTAQAVKLLGFFKGDIQKTTYIGHLNYLLYQKTENLFKKPNSLNISTSQETLDFLKTLVKQIQMMESTSTEIANAIFKANILKRIVDNNINNQKLNELFQSRISTSLTIESYYRLEIFNCFMLPESEIVTHLDKLRDEHNEIIKAYKEIEKNKKNN